MEILINKKARILLKEGTGAMREMGKAFWGSIKDFTEVYQQNLSGYISKILLVEDAFGEKSFIPLDDVENIQYI
jgi:hypothetical protein